MSDAPTPHSTPVPHEPDMHHGTFAEGQSDTKAFPEDEHVGTFAEGELKPEIYPKTTTLARSPTASAIRRNTPRTSTWGGSPRVGRDPSHTTDIPAHVSAASSDGDHAR